MRRRTLTDLANNPDLISGIYNYCDRWCERCPLTSRCLVYAAEQEDNDRAVHARSTAVDVGLSNILKICDDQLVLEGGAGLIQVEDRLTLCLRVPRRNLISAGHVCRKILVVTGHGCGEACGGSTRNKE